MQPAWCKPSKANDETVALHTDEPPETMPTLTDLKENDEIVKKED